MAFLNWRYQGKARFQNEPGWKGALAIRALNDALPYVSVVMK